MRLIIEPIVRAALLEDLGRAGDITTEAIVPGGGRGRFGAGNHPSSRQFRASAFRRLRPQSGLGWARQTGDAEAAYAPHAPHGKGSAVGTAGMCARIAASRARSRRPGRCGDQPSGSGSAAARRTASSGFSASAGLWK